MPTAKKAATIEELRTRIAASPNIFFTSNIGLTVEETSKLRRELRKDGTSYSVVKNSLFAIAAGEELAGKLETVLAGPTAIVFAGVDPVAPAKALRDFADDTKKLKVKAAYIDGVMVDEKQVAELAALPPKIELLARLVGSLSAPLRGLVTVLSGNQRGLVRVLDQIREQKAAGAPAPEPSAPEAEAPAAADAVASTETPAAATEAAPVAPAPEATAPEAAAPEASTPEAAE